MQNQKNDLGIKKIDLGIVILTKRKVNNFLKTEIFLKKFLTNSLIEPERFFKNLPILCKVVTTGGFRSSNLLIFDLRSTPSFDSVQRTVESFDTINRQLIERPELLDTLKEKFMEYQTILKGDIPQHIQDEAFVRDTSQSDHYRMDMVWGYLRQRFPLLSEIA